MRNLVLLVALISTGIGITTSRYVGATDHGNGCALVALGGGSGSGWGNHGRWDLVTSGPGNGCGNSMVREGGTGSDCGGMFREGGSSGSCGGGIALVGGEGAGCGSGLARVGDESTCGGGVAIQGGSGDTCGGGVAGIGDGSGCEFTDGCAGDGS